VEIDIVFSAHLLLLYSIIFIANYMRISVNVVGRHLFNATKTEDGPSAVDTIRNFLSSSGVFTLLNDTGDTTDRKLEQPGLLELTPHIRDKCLGSSEHFLNIGLPILAEIVSQACVGALDKYEKWFQL
jgi:hypothetical protein